MLNGSSAQVNNKSFPLIIARAGLCEQSGRKLQFFAQDLSLLGEKVKVKRDL